MTLHWGEARQPTDGYHANPHQWAQVCAYSTAERHVRKWPRESTISCQELHSKSKAWNEVIGDDVSARTGKHSSVYDTSLSSFTCLAWTLPRRQRRFGIKNCTCVTCGNGANKCHIACSTRILHQRIDNCATPFGCCRIREDELLSQVTRINVRLRPTLRNGPVAVFGHPRTRGKGWEMN